MDTPGRRLGKYTLVKKLAVGGMAEIWLAEQTGPAGFHKQCVVKQILPQLATDHKFVEMFLDEARLAAQLEHPNIVRITDLGEESGSFFIAMEYIDGPDIDYMIERCEQLGVTMPLEIAARIMADALNGLEYAHNFVDHTGNAVRLVHRDISPHNILVNRAGIAKIVDFGVAKAATSSHKTQTGAVKGKFAYMSPEQISNHDLDGRSDLFAMGIVLYEMTTNHRPFGDEGDLLAVTAILMQPPANIREIVSDFPPELEKIIMKALAKNREERYGSAREMAQELERFIASTGRFVGTGEVSAYLKDLFSESPSFLQGGAAPPLAPRYEGEDGQGTDVTPMSSPAPANPTRSGPAVSAPPPSRPNTQQQPPVRPEPPSRPVDVAPDSGGGGGGGKGMLIGIIVAVVVVLGIGGGVGAAIVFGGDKGGRGTDPVVEADTGTGGETNNDQAGGEEDASEEADVEEAPPAETGSVFVKTMPEVMVYVGNKKKGKTPLTLKLPLGKQKISLRDKERYLRREIEVEVKKDKVVDVEETFVLGELKLNVQPPDENVVKIDGEEFKGDLNKPISLFAGEYTVRVKNNVTGSSGQKKVKVTKGGLVVEEYDLR